MRLSSDDSIFLYNQQFQLIVWLCFKWTCRNLTVECTHNSPNPTDRCSCENWYWPIDGSSIEDASQPQQHHHHVRMYRMPSNKLSRCHGVIALANAMNVIDTSFYFGIFVDDYRRRFSESSTQLQNERNKNHWNYTSEKVTSKLHHRNKTPTKKSMKLMYYSK